jgi:hypothetical protein
MNLTPYANGLLLYQTGTTQLTVNGNTLSGGTIFAPDATVVLNGNSGSNSGFVEALDLVVNGNNWSFTGTGPPLGGGSSGALVQ